jgi:hypothetical protein
MELQVSEFRSIAEAVIVMERIAVVSAPNGKGKSSLAMALRATLTGNPLPQATGVDRYDKAALAALVRDGQTQGVATLAAEEGSIGIAWPEGQPVSKGKPPVASRCAAGYADAQIALLPLKDRPAALVKLLGAEPTRADLDKALVTDAALPAAVAEAVWKKIATDGWDPTAAYAHERVVSNKALWKKATGENWGSAKAAGWRPTHWKPGYEGITLETAQAKVRDLEQKLVDAQAKSLASADRRAALQAEAEKVAPLETRCEEMIRAAMAADARFRQAEVDLAANPLPSTGPAVPCPHCGKPVKVDRIDGRPALARAEDAPTQAELGARQARHDTAKAALDKAVQERDEANAAKTRCFAELEQANKAKRELDALPAASDPGTLTAVANIGAELQDARTLVTMIETVAEADKMHRAVVQSSAIHAALLPSGLRQKALDEALTVFNGELREQAASFGCPPPAVTPELAIMVGDRAYRDCSESEKFRARLVMQVAIARRDGSICVVVDNDVDMDKVWYGRLLKLLIGSGLHCLLTVRVNGPEAAIRVDKAPMALQQLVRCYYLEDGRAVPVDQLPAKVAA